MIEIKKILPSSRFLLFVCLMCGIAFASHADEISLSETADGTKFLLHRPSNTTGNKVAIALGWRQNWFNGNPENDPVAPRMVSLLLRSGAAIPERSEEAQVLSALRDAGASVQIKYTPDAAVSIVTARVDGLENALKQLESLLANADYRTKRAIEARTNIVERFYSNSSSNLSMIQETLVRAVLPSSPLLEGLKYTPLQRYKEVQTEDLERWHSEVFTTRPSLIAVSGSISEQEAKHAIEEFLSKFQTRYVPTERRRPTSLNGPTRPIFVVNPEATSSIVGILGMLPPENSNFSHLDPYIVSYLSMNDLGPVFSELRRNLGSSYATGGRVFSYTKEARGFFIWADAIPIDTEKAILALKEVYGLEQSNPDKEKVSSVFPLLLSYRDNARADVSISASWLLERAIWGNLEDAKQDHEALNDFTVDLLVTRLRSFPVVDDLILIAAGPLDAAPKWACVVEQPEEVLRCFD